MTSLSSQTHLQVSELLVGEGLDGTGIDDSLLIPQALCDSVLRVDRLGEASTKVQKLRNPRGWYATGCLGPPTLTAIPDSQLMVILGNHPGH